MTYTITINEQTYNLPPKNMKIAGLIDACYDADNSTESYKAQFKVVNEMFNKDEVKELLGSNKIDEVDLTALTLFVKKIESVYAEPITDFDNAETLKTLDSDVIRKIVEVSNAAEKIK